MRFHRSLFRRAANAAAEAKDTAARLQREITDLKQRTAHAQAEFENAKSAVDRLDSFEPDFDGDFQCPDCWVIRGVRSKLILIPSDDQTDRLRCKTCHMEISVG